MVEEKNADLQHDFAREPIRPRIEGEWVYATGTTLGADNGIGVAAALAAATDGSVEHGPLQLLFTMDEETGLTGAQQLDAGLIEGRVLLNLDSEEDGTLFVGCAGGADAHLAVDLERGRPTAGNLCFNLEVAGLRGGHSGMSIHEGRGNAVKLLARMLRAMVEAGMPLELGRIAGGDKHNAIPREAEASILLPATDEGRCGKIAGSMLERFREELAGVDEGVRVKLAPAEWNGEVFLPAARDRLLDLLAVLPHGPLAMSRDVPGLVETSNNLASVRTEEGKVTIVTSGRSSVGSAMAELMDRIGAAGRLAGANVKVHDGYPGWKPDMSSKLLEVVRGVYSGIWGKPPEVTAVHAGLECGLLGEKVPGMEMISFGPQIEGPHSPDERVNIPSVERFWRALCRVLDELAPKKG
jgi:dipeptidase D